METAMAAKSHEKLIKEIGSMTVLELADLVKALEEKFDISAAMPVAAATAVPVAAEAVAEEKSEYTVKLQDIGSEKIKVIKTLRKVIPNLALSDAKKMAEGAPVVIADAASKEDAEKMKKELEAVGAKIELA